MKKLLLALSISALTAGCQITTIQTKPADNANDVTVNMAASNIEKRLTCNREEQADAACDLRIYQVMVESFIDAGKTDLSGITRIMTSFSRPVYLRTESTVTPC